MTWAIIAFLYVSGVLLTADCIKIMRPNYPVIPLLFIVLTWFVYGPAIFGVRTVARVFGK